MKPLFPIAILSIVLLSSCVTKKEYQEMEELKAFYEQEAQSTDSLQNEYNKLAEESRQLEIEVRNTRLELEEYVVTNKSLNRSYQDVLQRLDRILDERNELDETASYEKVAMQRQLALQQQDQDRDRERLEGLEYELYQKGNRLNTIEYDYSSMKGTLQERNIRIQELEQMLNLKEDNMRGVRAGLDDLVQQFSSRGLSVEDRGGKLYVSLSAELLFPSGSTRIDPSGKSALQQLAAALKNNPDIDILVEGHTDSDGSALNNWNLSVNRAVSVTQILTQFGVDPQRLTAAGRGENLPVATNKTAAGKAQNRRTEIVISPKLDEVYELLSN
ncbi:MAG: OmpA family protein [Phaeodactylibacter sp.]|uniref:OmpA family protein n=1 Tax=Phaeodactylibacter sp. TaxID=1940289 RepID=UPI0032EE147B